MTNTWIIFYHTCRCTTDDSYLPHLFFISLPPPSISHYTFISILLPTTPSPLPFIRPFLLPSPLPHPSLYSFIPFFISISLPPPSPFIISFFPFYLSFLPFYRPPSFTLSIPSPHSPFFLPSLVLSFISLRNYSPSVQFAASDGHQGGDCCPGGIGEHPQSGQSNKRSR